MDIEVLCVCRRPPGWVTELTRDYQRRMPRELTVAFTYITPGHDSLSYERRQEDEAARILKRVEDKTALVALDAGGVEHTSEQVANWLNSCRGEHSKLTLAIGGADGHGSGVLSRARKHWSLSRLTLPHLLVQVVLAEQLYRAWTIIAGHPYHRG